MKKMTAFLVLFLILLPFPACQRSINDVQLMTVDIDPKSQPKGSLMLSDLVERVEYIPLETNDNCIVGNIYNLFDVSENYIAVSDFMFQRQVFLFDRAGRFITKIGSRGQGPGEYVMQREVFIDESKKCIYVKDLRKLLMYDFSGKHLNSFSFDEDFAEIYPGSDNQFITARFSNQSNEDYDVYVLWDSTMNLVKRAVKGVPIIIRSQIGASYASIGSISSCYIYQGFSHLKENVLNDTVYLVNKNNEFIPKYIINFGRYTTTPEDKGDVDNYWENRISGKFIAGVSVFEASNFLFPRYNYRDKWIPCYFDKKTNQLLYFDSEEGIPDDYTGGIVFWPSKQKNNELYIFYNSYDLLKKIDQQNKLTPKGPAESVRKVQSLLENLDPEDNPVLIIATLKE